MPRGSSRPGRLCHGLCPTWLTVLLALGWLASPELARAGPWTRAPGHGYAKLSASLFRAHGFRAADGTFNDAARYGSLTTALYGELGLVRDLHLQAYLPVVRARNDLRVQATRAFFCRDGRRIDDAGRTTLGDGLLALQYTPGLLALPHALRLESKWPLYDPSAPGGPCGPLFPQPGDGQVDVTGFASLGESFQGGLWFAFAELGYRHRTPWHLWGTTGRTFSDNVVAYAQVGLQYQPGEFLMLASRLELPFQQDDSSRGAWLIAPSWAIPLGAGLALELEVGFVPWARNAAVGDLTNLFWTQASAGLSSSF